MKSTIATNRCTGQRYLGESLSLNRNGKWHGKFGHFNSRVLDHDDVRTGRGKHDRVMTTLPQGNDLYMRVDHLWELGMPTEKQLVAVARKHDGLRGKWKLVKTTLWDEGKSTDCHFERVK